MRNYFSEAVAILPSVVKAALLKLPEREKEEIEEIRLRSGKPLCVEKHGVTYFVTTQGTLSTVCGQTVLAVEPNQVQYALLRACDDSIHTQQEHINQGFVTLPGGHRLGLCGTAAVQQDKLLSVRHVSALNLRIAREVPGCARSILSKFGTGVSSFLLAGPPASGKTTLLRDIAFQISHGTFQPPRKVAVVDERGEIAATYQGVVQNDLGPCTDVLDGYPKSVGITTALRVLSPHVILCDEIGTMEEVASVIPGLHSGVTFILSVHAASREELIRRKQIAALLQTGAFAHVVLLRGDTPGQVENIYRAEDLRHEMDSAPHDFSGLRRHGTPLEQEIFLQGAHCGAGTAHDIHY